MTYVVQAEEHLEAGDPGLERPEVLQIGKGLGWGTTGFFPRPGTQ